MHANVYQVHLEKYIGMGDIFVHVDISYDMC